MLVRGQRVVQQYRFDVRNDCGSLPGCFGHLGSESVILWVPFEPYCEISMCIISSMLTARERLGASVSRRQRCNLFLFADHSCFEGYGCMSKGGAEEQEVRSILRLSGVTGLGWLLSLCLSVSQRYLRELHRPRYLEIHMLIISRALTFHAPFDEIAQTGDRHDTLPS